MSREEAIRIIILKYCRSIGITPTEFSRKCEISKSYMSKIINKKYGGIGISMVYLSRIAKGMQTNEIELQKLIAQYQDDKTNDIEENEMLFLSMKEKIIEFNDEEIKKIHSIILNLNSERLETIHNLLQSMK